MKLQQILKALEKDYGWSFYDEKKKLHLTKMQKELILDVMKVVKNFSSNLPVSGSVFHCDICGEKATQAYRYQGSIEYLYRCEKHLR